MSQQNNRIIRWGKVLSKFEQQKEWALKLQPFAIEQHYSNLWPDADINELDLAEKESLGWKLDISGADKYIHYPDGRSAFLAQRFRSAEYADLGDFTLRETEWRKVQDNLNDGVIAGYYSYGVANEEDNGFIWLKILRFRPFIEWALSHQEPRLVPNKKGPGFYAWPFAKIPSDLIVYRHPDTQPILTLPDKDIQVITPDAGQGRLF